MSGLEGGVGARFGGGGLECAFQRMLNDLPLEARPLGAAPAVEAGPPAAEKPGEKWWCDPGTSRTGVAVQRASVIVPRRPSVTAPIFVNATEPKLARLTVRHPDRSQVAGASAIHSADERSGELTASAFEKLTPVVVFAIRNSTLVRAAFTLTEALRVSPASILSFRKTPGLGGMSYQAEYLGSFAAVQSASAPICTSPVARSTYPPRPTQNAEPATPDAQADSGCFQVAVTLVNEIGIPASSLTT